MSDIVSEFQITVDQTKDYEFVVRFKPEQPELHMDEPPPLGHDSGPSASRILAAAIGNCLSASLVFASRKQGVQLTGVHASVKVQIGKNERKRLRVQHVAVTIDPRIAPEDAEKLKAAAAVFEDFCTVTASIRQGIPVDVTVIGV